MDGNNTFILYIILVYIYKYMTKNELEHLRNYIEELIELDRLNHDVDARLTDKYQAEDRLKWIEKELLKKIK